MLLIGLILKPLPVKIAAEIPKISPKFPGITTLLDQAESNLGEPARRRLSSNLQVDIKVTQRDLKTHLQIPRSGRFPGESEWRSILRHWPCPVSVKPKEFKY